MDQHCLVASIRHSPPSPRLRRVFDLGDGGQTKVDGGQTTDGVLGPNAACRKEVVNFGRTDDVQDDNTQTSTKRRSYTWSELMARAFLIDVLECPKCSGRMKLIALIDEPRVVRKILEHLCLPTDIPSPRPARSPPMDWDEPTYFVDP